jgi:pimeloyl-ACP methyl ester carboxylesterase
MENKLIHSDIPTLVLAGEYDPVQPPAWGQPAASTLATVTIFLCLALGTSPAFSGAGKT